MPDPTPESTELDPHATAYEPEEVEADPLATVAPAAASPGRGEGGEVRHVGNFELLGEIARGRLTVRVDGRAVLDGHPHAIEGATLSLAGIHGRAGDAVEFANLRFRAPDPRSAGSPPAPAR